MKKIKKIWKNKFKILEGMWFNHIVFFFNKKHWALKLVKNRREICKACPHLDKEGKSEEVIIPGFPACGICGCNIKEMTASLSYSCPDNPKRWEPIQVKNDYILEDHVTTNDRKNGQVY